MIKVQGGKVIQRWRGHDENVDERSGIGRNRAEQGQEGPEILSSF